MRARWLFASLFFVIAVACSSDDPAATGVVLRDTTKIVPDAALASIAVFDAASGRIEIDATDARVPSLAVGDVVAASVGPRTPAGFLRRVVSTRDDGDRHILETSQATLPDAIAQGHIEASSALTRAMMTSTGNTAGGVVLTRKRDEPTASSGDGLTFGLTDVVIADADGDSKTTDDRLLVTGNVSVKPDVNLTIDISLSGLNELSFALSSEVTLAYSIRGNYGLKFEEKITLATVYFAPVVIPVGPLPLVFIPQLDIVAGANGSLSVGWSASGVATASAKVGVGYKDGNWGPFSSGDASYTREELPVGGNLSAKVFAGPELAFKLYGVSGPYARLSGYAKTGASFSNSPCWSTSVGFEAIAGFEASVFGVSLASYEAPIASKDVPVLTGACDPGGAHLNPTNATWARSAGGPGPDAPQDFRGMVALEDGSVVVAAQGTNQIWLFRFQPDGTLVWQRAFDGVFSIRGVAKAADGRIVIGGAHVSSPWAAKLDLDGNLLWSYVYAPSVYQVYAFDGARDGGFVLAGSVNVGGSDYDDCVIKIDGSGTPLWGYSYNGGDQPEKIRAVGADGEQGFALVGHTIVGPGNAGHIMRLDNAGAVVWHNTLSDAVWNLLDVSPRTDGGMVVSGYSGDGAVSLFYDAAGAPRRGRVFYERDMPSLEYTGRAIAALPFGYVAAGGRGFGASGDALLYGALDSGLTFAFRYAGAQEDVFTGVMLYRGGILVAGQSASFAQGGTRGPWLVFTTSTGDAALDNGATRTAQAGNFDQFGTSLPGGGALKNLTHTSTAVTRATLNVTLAPAINQDRPVPSTKTAKIGTQGG